MLARRPRFALFRSLPYRGTVSQLVLAFSWSWTNQREFPVDSSFPQPVVSPEVASGGSRSTGLTLAAPYCLATEDGLGAGLAAHSCSSSAGGRRGAWRGLAVSWSSAFGVCLGTGGDADTVQGLALPPRAPVRRHVCGPSVLVDGEGRLGLEGP